MWSITNCWFKVLDWCLIKFEKNTFNSYIYYQRFKCKDCSNFDFCERCFYSRKSHKHGFIRIAEPGSPAVFAGRPGRVRRREPSGTSNLGLIEDWSMCVKTMGVSSRESWAYRLTDGTSSYWQSCGTQGSKFFPLI